MWLVVVMAGGLMVAGWMEGMVAFLEIMSSAAATEMGRNDGGVDGSAVDGGDGGVDAVDGGGYGGVRVAGMAILEVKWDTEFLGEKEKEVKPEKKEKRAGLDAKEEQEDLYEKAKLANLGEKV